MKKIYMLAAAAILAAGAQAQTLSFTMLNGTPITPGSTVSFNDGEVEIDQAYDWGMWTYDPHIKITSDINGSVNVVANCTTGQSIQMCCGGQCEKGPRVEKNNVALTAGTPLDIAFEYAEEVEGVPNIKVPENVTTEISAEYVGNPASKVEFVLVCNSTEGGIVIGVYEKAGQLTSVNGSLEYSVEDACTLALYSQAGERVLTTEVEGNGAISTVGLAKGVYVYTLGTKSGKLIVK